MPRHLLLLFCLCLGFVPCVAHPSTTQEKLRGTQKQLEEQRRALEETKRRETAVVAELQRMDEEIRRLEGQLAEAQRELEARTAQKRELEARLGEIQAQHDRIQQRTARLARMLWMATVRLGTSRPEGWSEADRASTWLAAILHELRRTRLELAEHQSTLTAQTEQVRAASQKLEEQSARLLSLREDLTRQRLLRVKQAEKLRAERLQGEAQLGSLLTAIEELRRKAALEAAQKISTAKGKLPWPVPGRVVGSFAPQANPPSTGIDIATRDGETAVSVAAGKVVHSDALRGLGQVVIVYHGETYYSVYAFLAEVAVREGEAVTQGSAIGRCGFSPKVKGPGLRFELRSGSRPLNPMEWLAPR